MVYVFTKPPKRIYPLNIPLVATLSISPETIPATIDVATEGSISTTKLTVALTNNTDFTLNNVKIILPSIGLDMLETVHARRDANLPWKSSDSMFTIGNIKSGETKHATISAFSTVPSVYSVRAWITTRENITTTTNQAMLQVQ